MKRLVSIFFCTYLLLHTEGGYAQDSYDKQHIQPNVTDSVFYEATDSLINTITIPKKHRKSPFAAAQQEYLHQPLESKSFDKNHWEQAKSGIDYSTDKIEKRKKETSPRGFNPIWGVLIVFLKWFFIIGSVVLLAYLILRFVGEGNIFGTKKRRITDPSVQIDLEHIEEHLETAELDPLINQAIADKNYTLAIRLYYLAILKELHLKGDIEWKKDKTNRMYVREMREHRFFEPFRSTTSTFERVWYGSQTIDERQFDIIQPNFQRLLKSIQ